MSTLYELLKVKENASQEELAESYRKILEKADSLPQTEKLIEQVRRIKIAYGILSNEEKRKKYDLDLATKRADELLENVQLKKEEVKTDNLQKQEITPEKEEKIRQAISDQIDQAVEMYNNNKAKQEAEEKLAQKEQKKLLRKAKREAKKQQQLRKEMEIQAYGKYLEKQGYKVKYPWTWIRIKRLLITITAVLIMGFILWHIPIIKNTLTDLYKENFVIKFFVDIIVSIFKAITDGIKSIFK